MAVEFLGKPEGPSKGESEALRKAAIELERKTPYASLIVVNGIGLKKGRMLINLYQDYSDYMNGLDTIRSLPNVKAEEMESFLVDLNDERNFRILSMAQIARHIQAFWKRTEE